MLKSVYLMPGMAANPRIFEFLNFPKKIQVIIPFLDFSRKRGVT